MPNVINRAHSSSTCRQVSRAVLLYLATSTTSGGCATRTGSSPDTNTQPAVVKPRPSAHSVESVMPAIFQHGTVTYDVTITSAVEATAGGDSLPRTDSSHVTAVLSAFFTPLTNQVTRADVRIDSISVVVPGSATTQSPGVIHTYQIGLGFDNRLLIQRPSVSTPCTLEQPTILTGEEILPVVPPMSAIPQSWSDTARLELCRGGIRLNVTRIAEYRRAPATSQQENLPIRIIRSTRTAFEGQGTQWQQAVEAIGKATTVDTLILSSSRLLSISGETHLELGFRSQFRAQEFRQVSYIELRLRN
jgi:hypothetical protein